MMSSRRTRMTYDGPIEQAVDWCELGRRIREAAGEAARLGLLWPAYARGRGRTARPDQHKERKGQ